MFLPSIHYVRSYFFPDNEGPPVICEFIVITCDNLQRCVTIMKFLHLIEWIRLMTIIIGLSLSNVLARLLALQDNKKDPV